MITGFRGTFVISWAQVELDGVLAEPAGTLAAGASWQWRGDAVRVDGPDSVLVLGDTEETANLHRHAARAANRLVGRAIGTPLEMRLPDAPEPVLNNGFSVTDGIRRYSAALIERASGPPLCMFLDELPPKDRELWISEVSFGTPKPKQSGELEPPVICFTPDTRIATPDGVRLVGDLAEDDLVQTKDDGPQPVRWIGRRRLSGARLYAMPELRPIRIRSGAMGMGQPDGDLLVSPQHRLLVKGGMAQSLFNADEVLVAAADLVNDNAIMVDRRLREVTYIHLLLDRHSIVFANGVEAESFHPATMDMSAVDPEQMARLSDRVPGVGRNPDLYGAFVRRMLSHSEAAILRHTGERRH